MAAAGAAGAWRARAADMSAHPDEQGSIIRRGCFVSGLIAVIVVIVLRQFLFRLPPLGALLLAACIWFGIFVLYMRRGDRRPR